VAVSKFHKRSKVEGDCELVWCTYCCVAEFCEFVLFHEVVGGELCRIEKVFRKAW